MSNSKVRNFPAAHSIKTSFYGYKNLLFWVFVREFYTGCLIFWVSFLYNAMNTPANENALFSLIRNKSLFVPHHWRITAVAC